MARQNARRYWNGIPGGAALQPLHQPPSPPFLRMRFIIFCICANCLSRRLTSCTWVPEPAAIRRLREPFMMAGKRRSRGVMELIIASRRTSSRSSTLSLHLVWQVAGPRQLVDQAGHAAHVAHLLELLLKVVQTKLFALGELLGDLLGLARSTFCSVSSMSVSTSPMPRMRDAMRSG